MSRMVCLARLAPLTLCLLAGCINLAPPHERPPLSTASAYDPAYRPDGSAVASQLGWQDYFSDPQLEALIGTALANNRDLLAATARIEQARAQYRIQRSQQLPIVGVNGSAIRSRVPLNTGSTGQGQGSIPPVTGGVPVTGGSAPGSVTFNRYDVSVGVSSFELDFWGRVRNLSDAARAQYLATVWAQRAFYLSLIGDVSSTYFDLIETREQIALAQATAQSRREGQRIAKIRLDAGVTSALDFRQAEALLTQAEQALAAQKLAEARTLNQLTVLVGGQIPSDLPAGASLNDQQFAGPLTAGLPSDLLLARPDIVAAEEQLRATRANIGAARAAFFPRISLTGNAGFASSDLGGLFSGDSFTWSFGPSISLPIFDWGARDADLGLARARETEAVAVYDRTVQTAFREVSDALAGRRYIGDQVATARRAVEAQQAIAQLARLRYREGVANYLEVLDAERNLFSAQQGLLEVMRTNDQNDVSLFIALGGGFGPQGALAPPVTPDSRDP